MFLHVIVAFCVKYYISKIEQVEAKTVTVGSSNKFYSPLVKSIAKKEKVSLSELNNMPILIKYDKYLGSIFHPELVNDTRIHQYFIEMINGNK